MFSQMDRKDDKAEAKKGISKAQLVTALPNADPAAVGRLFDVFAAGADEIDYRLFVCAAAVMADAEPSAKMQLVFELCDEDAGGSLSRAELREPRGGAGRRGGAAVHRGGMAALHVHAHPRDDDGAADHRNPSTSLPQASTFPERAPSLREHLP